jgi:cellulose synthase/poly-beta-1,6-N-acetylglucosamine synthase-like glycosyltransferase
MTDTLLFEDFWLAVLAAASFHVIYVVALYPLCLGVWAALRPTPVRCGPIRPSVSIILPVRNGSRWIESKLRSLDGLDYPAELLEIVLVADGCTDDTAKIAEEFTPRTKLRVLEIPHSGKAAALNLALKHSVGEVLFFTDVRQLIDPSALTRLVECLADSAVGAVSGELFIGADGVEEKSVGLYWEYEKWIRRRQSRIWTMPGATGAIYVMRRSLVRELPVTCLNDDVYLPLLAIFAGYRVVLEGSAKAYDEPALLTQELTRKVRTQAGIYQLIGFFPKLLLPWNPIFFHFASHKLGRLLMPFSLAALLPAAALAPIAWGPALAMGQVGFWFLAVVDQWIPDNVWLKRISSPVRAFATLQLAALWAISFFASPARSLWRDVRTK